MPRLNTLSNSGSSDCDSDSFEPWGCKILPKNEFACDQNTHVACRRLLSTECENSSKKSESGCHPERRSMPCIHHYPSPAKVLQNHDEQETDLPVSVKSSTQSIPPSIKSHSSRHSMSSISDHSCSSSSEICWIDKTPSESSLHLPFCPPVQLDYEDFSKSITVQKMQSKSKVPARSRRSYEPPERELKIIPLDNIATFPDFQRLIPSSVILLPSSQNNFNTFRESVFHASKIIAREIPPPKEEISPKKNHYVEVVIQISPPPEFSSNIIPPPISFSTTVTKPTFPVMRNSDCLKCQNMNSLRSSMRDSGLADVSPNTGRKKHPSSTTSLVISTTPTSGLSSDDATTSLARLPTSITPSCVPLKKHLEHNSCCFRDKKCLPINFFNRRKFFLRQRSQSMDDSNMYQALNGSIDSDNALSCMELPSSSLSRDIFEDEGNNVERTENEFHVGIHSGLWLKTIIKEV